MTEHDDTPAPLSRYLAELDSLMTDLDPVERAEIVLGVRDHVEGLLEGTDRSDHAVHAALAEVGPATAVADAAYDGRPRTERDGPSVIVAPTPVPATSRAWLPFTVVALQVVALLLVLSVFGLTSAVSGSSISGTTGPVTDARTGVVVEPETTTVTSSSTDLDTGAVVAGAVGGVFASLPAWLGLGVLVGICGLWTAREKVLLVALTPLAAAVLAASTLLGAAVLGSGSVGVGGVTGLVLVLLGVAVTLTRLVRRALRRGAPDTAPSRALAARV